MIPHSFGLAAIPLLDTREKLKKKKEMLKSLVAIQMSFEMMKKAKPDQNSLEAYYMQLNAEVLPIDHDSKGYKLIETYAKNTANGLKLEIADVYKVNRKGEKERYAKFKNLPNRMLLWHGSDVTNFSKIISQGLVITKKPANGRMFGDCLYFAEMLCKSLNYCKTKDASGYSYLVLCEVALGKMKEYTAQNHDPLPQGYNSVKGIGKTRPDPKEAYTRKDGVVIPLGHPVDTNHLSPLGGYHLNYNEYMVYDENQVNIQYLVKLKAT